ncbi:MAG: glycine oxidase ThiO [Halofilum sp. (in: g-proteobacteria)]
MPHALIAGGGLIGLLTARELRARGFDVTVVERGACAREASWAGGGILSPLHPWRFPDAVTALARRSQAAWPRLAATLRGRTGIDPEYRPGGMLVIDTDDPAEVGAWAACHGVALRPLARAQVTAMVAGLRPPAGNPRLLPDVASIRNPRLLRALIALVAGEGVTLREHTPVTGIARAGGRVIGLDTASGRIGADAVVICAGAWSAGLLTGLDAEPPGIRPVRGQMLAFAAAPGLLERIVLTEDHYLSPRADGTVLAGSTLEDVGFDPAPTAAGRAELFAAATRLLPGLAETPVRAHWAGLRPGSDDGVPTIAPHPELAGLWINAGHFRNGIVTAPASAELAADLVAGRPPPLDPTPLLWPPAAGDRASHAGG